MAFEVKSTVKLLFWETTVKTKEYCIKQSIEVRQGKAALQHIDGKKKKASPEWMNIKTCTKENWSGQKWTHNTYKQRGEAQELHNTSMKMVQETSWENNQNG